MRPDIREAFDSIHADETLKDNTRRFVLEELEKRQKKQRSLGWKMAYAVAACLVVCLALVGGHHLYFSPTSIISIDVNPSIELSVNRFDKVVAVDGYNEDGVAFAETLDVLYQDYQDAVEEILESDTITQCLAREELLSVAVVEIDEVQGEAILEYVSQCTAHQENTYCYGVTSDEVEEAHSLGLSYGKYKVYAEITQYTTQLSPEEANNMTMRQLRDYLEQLQGEEETSSGSEESSSHQGNGNGQGAGKGQGNGAGNGQGLGMGQGNGQGSGMGQGNGAGNGQGSGMGQGTGTGNGSGNGQGSGGKGQGQGGGHQYGKQGNS